MDLPIDQLCTWEARVQEWLDKQFEDAFSIISCSNLNKDPSLAAEQELPQLPPSEFPPPTPQESETLPVLHDVCFGDATLAMVDDIPPELDDFADIMDATSIGSLDLSFTETLPDLGLLDLYLDVNDNLAAPFPTDLM